jgi:hypothetical protein
MSKSVYQAFIMDILENNSNPLTIRDIMKIKDIPIIKNTYVISAVKKLIEQNKVRISSLSKNKTMWMDAYITLN